MYCFFFLLFQNILLLNYRSFCLPVFFFYLPLCLPHSLSLSLSLSLSVYFCSMNYDLFCLDLCVCLLTAQCFSLFVHISCFFFRAISFPAFKNCLSLSLSPYPSLSLNCSISLLIALSLSHSLSLSLFISIFLFVAYILLFR